MLKQLYPGIWKYSIGQAELFTPVSLRAYPPAQSGLENLPFSGECPIPVAMIQSKLTTRGCLVELPLKKDEHIYGMGLQLFSVDHLNTKKVVRVNADPMVGTGDSHAPVPFYLSTHGYGVFVDTARYATFYFGSTKETFHSPASGDEKNDERDQSKVVFEVPSAKGVDIYIFAGPDLLNVVQRYNLFSGGGFVPPRWGLGFWYRCDLGFDQNQVEALCDELRGREIPCDVIGLEPGWQTQSYSCSFVWSQRFKDVDEFIADLSDKNFRLNLWTHVFTHPSSPIFNALLPFSGDYMVWDGLVPDLTLDEVQEIMSGFFDEEHVSKGVASYKLDECDNSDFNPKAWSFPEISQFPSGLDGEQMHSFLGLKFQQMVSSIYRKKNLRTFGEVRSSHALAAPSPFVLYSDLYDHSEFIRGLVNCGFSGILWCPEVRDASSEEDLIRRLQSVIFSPQALVNGWYIPNFPWKQFDREKNKANVFLDNWEDLENMCRKIIKLRMQLIPYLYSAFYDYFEKGIPPFRALVCDYPHSQETFKIDDQFLVGDRLMVAPVVAGKPARKVYLPPGEWVDYWTNQLYRGDTTIALDVPLDTIPIYVKNGSVLPLATPTLNTEDPDSLKLSIKIYGDGSLPISLPEDDGVTYDYQNGKYNRMIVSWNHKTDRGMVERTGNFDYRQYKIIAWEKQNPG